MLSKEEKLHGLQLRAKELQKQRDKHHDLLQRYDAFYTAYSMFCNAIENNKGYPLKEVSKYIKANEKYLAESDLCELRKVYELILEDPIMVVREELGAREITDIIEKKGEEACKTN